MHRPCHGCRLQARKLWLTTFILFVDIKDGSSQLLRLLLSSFVSVLFLTALCLARPHRRYTDHVIACTAQTLLVCSLVSAVGIKLCEAAPVLVPKVLLIIVQDEEHRSVQDLVGSVYAEHLRVAVALQGVGELNCFEWINAFFDHLEHR